MELTGTEWLIVILLVIGVALTVFGLSGRMRFRVLLVGAALTTVAVILIFMRVSEDEAPTPTPTPSAVPAAIPGPSPGADGSVAP